jgi:hypothetical protein
MQNLPLLGNAVSIRHAGRTESVLTNRSGRSLFWKAAFQGRWATLAIDGRTVRAESAKDDSGRDVSWVLVPVEPGGHRTVRAPKAEADSLGPL